MVDAGCDIIEVGIAYSDPVMDGPTIRPPPRPRCAAASGCATCSTVVEQIASVGGKAVVMTYWNPVLQYGVDRFAVISPPPAASA